MNKMGLLFFCVMSVIIFVLFGGATTSFAEETEWIFEWGPVPGECRVETNVGGGKPSEGKEIIPKPPFILNIVVRCPRVPNINPYNNRIDDGRRPDDTIVVGAQRKSSSKTNPYTQDEEVHNHDRRYGYFKSYVNGEILWKGFKTYYQSFYETYEYLGLTPITNVPCVEYLDFSSRLSEEDGAWATIKLTAGYTEAGDSMMGRLKGIMDTFKFYPVGSNSAPTNNISQTPNEASLNNPPPPDDEPSSGRNWILWVGPAALSFAAAKLAADYWKRRREKGDKSDKPPDGPVGYVLQISQDRFELQPKQTVKLSVSVWAVDYKGGTTLAAGASIQMQPPAGVQVSPSSGQTRMEANITALPDLQPGNHTLTVTAQAGGSQYQAQVVLVVASTLLEIQVTPEGKTSIYPVGKDSAGIYARINPPDAQSVQEAQTATNNITIAPQDPVNKWIDMGDLLTKDGWRCRAVGASNPDPLHPLSNPRPSRIDISVQGEFRGQKLLQLVSFDVPAEPVIDARPDLVEMLCGAPGKESIRVWIENGGTDPWNFSFKFEDKDKVPVGLLVNIIPDKGGFEATVEISVEHAKLRPNADPNSMAVLIIIAKSGSLAPLERHIKLFAGSPNLNVTPKEVFFLPEDEPVGVYAEVKFPGNEEWEIRAELKNSSFIDMSGPDPDGKNKVHMLLTPKSLPEDSSGEKGTLEITAASKHRTLGPVNVNVIIKDEGLVLLTDPVIVNPDPRAVNPGLLKLQVFRRNKEEKRIILDRIAMQRGISFNDFYPGNYRKGESIFKGAGVYAQFKHLSGSGLDEIAVYEIKPKVPVPCDASPIDAKWEISAESGDSSPDKFMKRQNIQFPIDPLLAGDLLLAKEINNCRRMISYLPEAQRAKWESKILVRDAALLGAKGLYKMRHEIWEEARGYLIRESQNYLEEANYNDRIVFVLEWSQWLNDMAWQAAESILTAPLPFPLSLVLPALMDQMRSFINEYCAAAFNDGTPIGVFCEQYKKKLKDGALEIGLDMGIGQFINFDTIYEKLEPHFPNTLEGKLRALRYACLIVWITALLQFGAYKKKSNDDPYSLPEAAWEATKLLRDQIIVSVLVKNWKNKHGEQSGATAEPAPKDKKPEQAKDKTGTKTKDETATKPKPNDEDSIKPKDDSKAETKKKPSDDSDGEIKKKPSDDPEGEGKKKTGTKPDEGKPKDGVPGDKLDEVRSDLEKSKADYEKNKTKENTIKLDNIRKEFDKTKANIEATKIIEASKKNVNDADKKAFEDGRRQGEEKVKALEKAAEDLRKNPDDKNAKKVFTDACEKVQQDKHAMHVLNDINPGKPSSLRQDFNEHWKQTYENTDNRVKERIAEELNRNLKPGETPYTAADIEVAKITNVKDSQKPTPEQESVKSTFDRDATFRKTKRDPITHEPILILDPKTGNPIVKLDPKTGKPIVKLDPKTGKPIENPKMPRDYECETDDLRTTNALDVKTTTMLDKDGRPFVKVVKGPIEKAGTGAKDIYNQEFYKERHGDYPYQKDQNGQIIKDKDGKSVIDQGKCNEYAEHCDQTITDRFHPDAYGGGKEDIGPATRGDMKGKPYKDVAATAKTMEFKVKEWYNKADHTADPIKQAEFKEEGMRQLTKQFDNQLEKVVEKYNELSGSPYPPVAKIPDNVRTGVDIMKRVGKDGFTVADAEAALNHIGETPQSIASKMSGILESGQKQMPPALRQKLNKWLKTLPKD